MTDSTVLVRVKLIAGARREGQQRGGGEEEEEGIEQEGSRKGEADGPKPLAGKGRPWHNRRGAEPCTIPRSGAATRCITRAVGLPRSDAKS